MLPPDLAHQPRTAVLPPGSWGALSTIGNCCSGLHSLLDCIDGILVQVREFNGRPAGGRHGHEYAFVVRTTNVRQEASMAELNLAVPALDSGFPMEKGTT